jgi:glucuronate isomerase
MTYYKTQTRKEIFKMNSNTFLVIQFPDNGEETVEKMLAILRIIGEDGGMDSEPDNSFIYEETETGDLPY